MRLRYRLPWSAVVLFTVIGLVFSAPVPASADSLLSPGDYAVYTFGECTGPRATYFFPPFYGIEDAEDPGDQIKMWGLACPVTLRWDVLSVGDGVAETQIYMEGWRYGYGDGKKYMYVGNETWSLYDDDPFHQEIVAILHTKHIVRIDLDTMDVTTQEGAYLGRWGFLVTPAEVAYGRADVIRNWYNGTALEANVTVTKELVFGQEVGLQRAYGVDTFITIRTWPTKVPFPEGLGRYLFTTTGGWNELRSASRVHDAATSLLLVSKSYHYDDLFFNLYGIIWLRDWSPLPGGGEWGVSSLTLVDTNIIDLPELEEDDGTGDQDDGSDSGDDSGDDGAGGQDGSGGDGDAGGDGTGDDGPVPPGFPWLTVSLFAAVAVVTALLAYQRLRPRREEKEGGTGSRREQRGPPSRKRR